MLHFRLVVTYKNQAQNILTVAL